MTIAWFVRNWKIVVGALALATAVGVGCSGRGVVTKNSAVTAVNKAAARSDKAHASLEKARKAREPAFRKALEDTKAAGLQDWRDQRLPEDVSNAMRSLP